MDQCVGDGLPSSAEADLSYRVLASNPRASPGMPVLTGRRLFWHHARSRTNGTAENQPDFGAVAFESEQQ